MDGTLADTALLTLEAFRRAVPSSGLPMPDPDVVRATIGYANPEFYYRIFPDQPRQKVDVFGARVEELELSLLPEMGERLLFPGVLALLQALAGRGIELFVASTGSEEHVFGVLEATGIRRYFQQVCCGAPDKAGMIAELKKGRDPARMLMIGDMHKDSQGAHANGIRAVGAGYGYCSRSEQDEFDTYIDQPGDLLALIG